MAKGERSSPTGSVGYVNDVVREAVAGSALPLSADAVRMLSVLALARESMSVLAAEALVAARLARGPEATVSARDVRLAMRVRGMTR